MEVVVSEVHELNPRVRSFVLVRPDGATLPAFGAGAHIGVHLPLDGGPPVVRRYSILSDPSQSGHYEIAVLRAPEGSGGSAHMHTRVRTGDRLEISGPHNQFPLAQVGAHNLLAAGGIGITPLLSMLHSLARLGASVEVHYVVRESARHIYRKTIEELAGDRAHFYVSSGPRSARLDLEGLCTDLDPGTEIYACGPPRFLECLTQLVASGRVPPEVMHMESFCAAPIEKSEGVSVDVPSAGISVRVGRGQAILSALLREGVPVPYDCMRGECGMCAVEYSGGEVLHRDSCLSDKERVHRLCLCVSQVISSRIVLSI